MQFLIGSLTTVVSMLIVFAIIRSNSKKSIRIKVGKTQSQLYDIIAPAIPVLEILKKLEPKETQSSNHEKSMSVRVLVMDNNAYWIQNNTVYEADVHGNQIDKQSAKIVDTMHMNNVELDRMMFIIDKLTKGVEDDRSNSGNS